MAVQRYRKPDGTWGVLQGGGGASAGGGVSQKMYELTLGINGDGTDLTAEDLQKNADLFNRFYSGTLDAPVYLVEGDIHNRLFAISIEQGADSEFVNFAFVMGLTLDPETFGLFGFVLNVAVFEDGHVELS